MNLNEITDLLNAKIHHVDEEDDLNTEIVTAAASDLMSDVLASVSTPDLLLTGLTNAQVIRTSSVSGIKAVVIVRGKSLEPKIIELAREERIAIMTTDISLFESCGILYQKGLKSANI
jgi:hypothetical protein